MNSRRSFLKTLAGAAVFSILPSAITYGRIWKPKTIVPVQWRLNPEWVNAPYEIIYRFSPNSLSILNGVAHSIVLNGVEIKLNETGNKDQRIITPTV